MEQCIRFCTTEDGVRIAYATSGAGLPIVRPGHWLTHLEYDLKSPVWNHLLAGLSERHLLVRYDPRGTGLSDRDVTDISPEGWLRDLEAVVRDLALPHFALLGISQGAATAIRYCARHPERVSHLVLYGAYARGRLHRDDPQFGPDMLDAMCTLIEKGWGSEDASYRELFSSRYVASGSREAIAWMNDLEAVSASPRMAARYFRAIADIDVRPLLPKLHVPTLVLHCRDDRAVPYRFGVELAAAIAGARFVPMEGASHLFLEHEPACRTFFDEVPRFLGDRPQRFSRRALARRGRSWRELVSRVHHAVEPYYVIAAVGSALAGAASYLLSRLG